MPQVVLNGKSLQEYPVSTRFPEGSILGPTLFLLQTYSNGIPDDAICNIAIYADNTSLCSNCYQASDLWQQLELASKLESDLQDNVKQGRKWLLDFNAEKAQLSNKTGAIYVKRNRTVLKEKSSFKMLELTFFSKLD